ncbi:TPA: translation elongation factor Ts [Candidatus Poribacteria bacterium]|nr:translation elongation factor Ts [Candidatus Poribacteria bacterium]HEX28468.1 translation elongation factor Ts [Candidatus Poribacteria bacterium]
MQVTAEMVKSLREKTGAGIMDCKKALQETNGDMEAAVEWLRRKGISTYDKRKHRAASEGVIASYIHAGSKIGVLLELNCETDFVARTDIFQQLAKDVAMQIAATDPKYISKEDVPPEVVEREKELLREQALNEGRPERVIDRIVEGRLEKFFTETCLLEQPFIKDDTKTVGELVKEVSAKVGENIVVRRFTRYVLGRSDDSD